jgi:putative zinc finger protein
MQDKPPTKTSLLAGVWKILTLKCDEATRLVSDGFERDLRPMERWALRMHLISCRPCRRMRAQFNLLHQAASRLAKSTHSDNDNHPSTDNKTP